MIYLLITCTCNIWYIHVDDVSAWECLVMGERLIYPPRNEMTGADNEERDATRTIRFNKLYE